VWAHVSGHELGIRRVVKLCLVVVGQEATFSLREITITPEGGVKQSLALHFARMLLDKYGSPDVFFLVDDAICVIVGTRVGGCSESAIIVGDATLIVGVDTIATCFCVWRGKVRTPLVGRRLCAYNLVNSINSP
jgi:hypothetical protein